MKDESEINGMEQLGLELNKVAVRDETSQNREQYTINKQPAL
ncbi:hypothetical protein [Streptomyces sp. NPDC050738]